MKNFVYLSFASLFVASSILAQQQPIPLNKSPLIGRRTTHKDLSKLGRQAQPTEVTGKLTIGDTSPGSTDFQIAANHIILINDILNRKQSSKLLGTAIADLNKTCNNNGALRNQLKITNNTSPNAIYANPKENWKFTKKMALEITVQRTKLSEEPWHALQEKLYNMPNSIHYGEFDPAQATTDLKLLCALAINGRLILKSRVTQK